MFLTTRLTHALCVFLGNIFRPTRRSRGWRLVPLNPFVCFAFFNNMLRNVEIKARVSDINRIIEIAKILSQSKGESIPQHDIFYNVPNGRLKLRKFEDTSTSLIFYDRPDTTGPKLSNYDKLDLPASSADGTCLGSNLASVLEKSLGIKGELTKVRHLFIIGQTRVHIDEVEGLGNYMELEVVLTPEQTLEDGQIIAQDLQKKLEVSDEDLLPGAYLDIKSKQI